jgi:hypothetical protein
MMRDSFKNHARRPDVLRRRSETRLASYDCLRKHGEAKMRNQILWAALAILGVTLGISAISGQDEQSSDETAALSGGESEGAQLREGAVVTDQPGTFQLVGNRMVFALEGDARQLGTLENLALERVVRLVRQSSAPQTWLVSGTVTEYQGSNFILIDRAVIRRSGETKSAGQ